MEKKSSPLFVVVLVLVSFLLVLGCSKKSTDSNPPPTPNQVLIKDSSFKPDSLAVDSGATVTWKNQDNFAHTVTSDTPVFDSGNLASGGSFPFTFHQKGIFPYHCNLHPAMHGKIVVK